MPTIAVPSTLAMVTAAEARGVDASAVLAGACVTRAHLEDPDGRLPAATVMTIWNELRTCADDCTLQLAAPATLAWGRYRVIDYLVASSETIGDGIDRFARFFGLIADTVSLSIEHCDDGHCLLIQRADGGPVTSVYVDYVFAALVTRIRLHIRPGLEVLRVELRQPQPADATAYNATFRAPVIFGGPMDRLWFSEQEWRSRPEHADAALAQVMEQHARMLGHGRGTSEIGFRRDVQDAITSALPRAATADDVAGVLCMSVRTLQRRLEESGTTFRILAETVRAQLAEQYLADKKVGIAEVAFLLGFSDQTSFNRAFRRWTGETPGRWRKMGAV